MSTAPLSRSAQKERTRRAVLDATLELTRDTPLAALSLRAVTKRVGIVPTAFYRHFDSVDDLGLALVDEAFASLRTMLKDVRRGVDEAADIIDASLAGLASDVGRHRDHYAFIVREKSAGTPVVAAAIQHEIELVTRELATDVARLSITREWSSEDLHLLADLIVSLATTTAERLTTTPQRADHIIARTRRQLRLLLVGVGSWCSD